MAELIKADGTRQEIVPENGKTFGLAELQKHVCGYIENVYLPNGKVMVINEEGRLYRLPLNKTATGIYRIAYNPFEIIVGDVVICDRGELN